MDLIKRKPGWWANLPLLEKGKRVLEAARDLEFDCRVLTKGPRTNAQAWKEKLDWSFANLGPLDVTITFDKGSVYGKFLYDDFPEYCYRWLAHRPRGLVIMPVERISRQYEHEQILQWDGTNFDQVKAALVACREREPHEPMVIPR
jgi:hypothetical protein